MESEAAPSVSKAGQAPEGSGAFMEKENHMTPSTAETTFDRDAFARWYAHRHEAALGR